MTGSSNSNQEGTNSTGTENDSYDSMLDELYDLHKKLLQQELQYSDPSQDQQTQHSDNLEIPILTQSLNQEIDHEHESRKVFDEAQHHLFEQCDMQRCGRAIQAPTITLTSLIPGSVTQTTLTLTHKLSRKIDAMESGGRVQN